MAQPLLRRSGVAVGEAFEFRIDVHRLIRHPLPTPAGKEFGERAAAAAECVSVGAAVEHPIVGNWDELESTVVEEWPLHATTASIHTNAKERDLQSTTRESAARRAH